MDFSSLPRTLIFIGLGLIVAGLFLWLLGKFGLPVGKLPGDINIQKKTFGISFPIMTSIVISLVLTILLNLILWLFRK